MSEIQKPLIDKTPEGSCSPEAVRTKAAELQASKVDFTKAEAACRKERGDRILPGPAVSSMNQRLSDPNYAKKLLGIDQNKAAADAAAKKNTEESIGNQLASVRDAVKAAGTERPNVEPNKSAPIDTRPNNGSQMTWFLNAIKGRRDGNAAQ